MNHTCEKCGHGGNKGDVCRAISQEQTNIDSLSMESVQLVGSVAWDDYSQKFVACHSARKPRSIIQMQPHVSSSEQRTLEKRPTDLRKRHIDSFVDSGALICAAGPTFLRQMRCHQGNLLINAAIRIKLGYQWRTHTLLGGGG